MEEEIRLDIQLEELSDSIKELEENKPPLNGFDLNKEADLGPTSSLSIGSSIKGALPSISTPIASKMAQDPMIGRVRNLIKRELNKNNGRMYISALQEALVKETNRSFSYKEMGFSKFTDMLNSMNDIVTYKGNFCQLLKSNTKSVSNKSSNYLEAIRKEIVDLQVLHQRPVNMGMVKCAIEEKTGMRFGQFGFANFKDAVKQIPSVQFFESGLCKIVDGTFATPAKSTLVSTPAMSTLTNGKEEIIPIYLNSTPSPDNQPRPSDSTESVSSPNLSESDENEGYLITSGIDKLKIPIDHTTEDIFLVDMDNSAQALIACILPYALKRNTNDPANHHVIVLGFGGLVLELPAIPDYHRQFFHSIRIATPTKEAVDHAITFYASRIHFEQKYRTQSNKRTRFFIVSKDLALYNTTHLLQQEGALSEFVASNTRLKEICK